MDYTNTMLIERGESVSLRTPEEAGVILADIVAAHRFTLYEYFITDKMGHAQDMEGSRSVLRNLARYIRTLLQEVDLNATTVVLTSDHGNIEDLSIRNHTLNLVPTLIWGKDRDYFASRITSLADITPLIVETLTAKAKAHS
jgi:bisphosphoglycerate-independent phosphoglycerate mutase (AlkP superfamily)